MWENDKFEHKTTGKITLWIPSAITDISTQTDDFFNEVTHSKLKITWLKLIQHFSDANNLIKII